VPNGVRCGARVEPLCEDDKRKIRPGRLRPEPSFDAGKATRSQRFLCDYGATCVVQQRGERGGGRDRLRCYPLTIEQRDCQRRVTTLDGIDATEVSVVWEPVWSPQLISPEGRAILGIEDAPAD